METLEFEHNSIIHYKRPAGDGEGLWIQRRVYGQWRRRGRSGPRLELGRTSQTRPSWRQSSTLKTVFQMEWLGPGNTSTQRRTSAASEERPLWWQTGELSPPQPLFHLKTDQTVTKFPLCNLSAGETVTIRLFIDAIHICDDRRYHNGSMVTGKQEHRDARRWEVELVDLWGCCTSCAINTLNTMADIGPTK